VKTDDIMELVMEDKSYEFLCP